MAAKNVTPKDRELLYAAYCFAQLGGVRTIDGKLSESKQASFFKLGLIEVERTYEGWDGKMYPIHKISPRGLQEIQSLIDKAAADKAAREAEAEAHRQMIDGKENLLTRKLSGFNLADCTVQWETKTSRYIVTFGLCLRVQFDDVSSKYRIRLWSYDSAFVDPEMIIQEAYAARTVAGILNGMLEQGEQS